jgi:hypothetical protein
LRNIIDRLVHRFKLKAPRPAVSEQEMTLAWRSTTCRYLFSGLPERIGQAEDSPRLSCLRMKTAYVFPQGVERLRH